MTRAWAGKLEAGYRVSTDANENTPAAVQAVFDRDELRSCFPPYPLGSELTQTEQELVQALEWLKAQTARPWSNLPVLVSALIGSGRNDNQIALERMGLDKTSNLKERVMRRLLDHALERTKV